MCVPLSNTALFRGIADSDIDALLPCIGAHRHTYTKGETILRAGETTDELGLVLVGSVNVVVNFWWGDSQIFGHRFAGENFALNYAAIPGRPLDCDVVAAEDCEILFLNLERVLTTCQKSCGYHCRLIRNLVRISAQRSLDLSARMMHTAPKTIRGRVLSYLSEQATLGGSPHVSIPFTRQQLADYLGVDRSALSNELSKMRRDGLVSFRRNEFTLHEQQRR